MKRRRLVRRVTILGTLIVISVSLILGVYFVYTLGGSSNVDSKIGQPVSATDLAALYLASLQPYGPAPTSSMASTVQNYAGAPFVSNGKPVVVYVGGEFCPYCAVQRWSLIMAMMRFGNFTNLHYIASALGDVGRGDYATFTFTGSSYSSKYVAFRPYEVEDRNRQTIATVPSNYSAEWTRSGSGFPFMNFGDRYVVPTSMLPDPTILTNKNWTQIISEIRAGDLTGNQFKESANLITAMICKLTNNSPASICSASPIATEVLGLAALSQSSSLATPLIQPGPKKYQVSDPSEAIDDR
jgi:thiol-disulfide isomerase/thioredoxin